jgi:hypothetical protein
MMGESETKQTIDTSSVQRQDGIESATSVDDSATAAKDWTLPMGSEESTHESITEGQPTKTEHLLSKGFKTSLG